VAGDKDNTEDLMGDAAMMGIALPEPEKSPDFEVWKENIDIVKCFLSVQSQWNTSVGGITGLNYVSVLAIIDMYKYDEPIAVFEGVQVMEAAAMALMNKEGK
jgi:hypothetical protein